MISPELQAEINKCKTSPRWNHLFPPYIEKHYFDYLLVYHCDRTNIENIYCDKFYTDGARPALIIIQFDNQLVFVKHNQTVLLDRLPAP
ncbi:hypothetical protein FNW02_05835 [Komarekiella sp. 'clone 1']|uniref:Uncharacterized protein n=1 Tax=Komarekiella delphini-convector SJRDD-AB1 TaxID=2593771 RepID=A0AA40VQM6_9NOST|nr:hypothetical protein [Komarekiella delphini-convector]MBD6615376.1 hypothetical protein [Komarekiella delphini-convector SJRDD-AB1]